MYEPETRIYLEPPLKNISEMQLLDCNIKTKRLINFKDRQIIENANNIGFIIIEPGTYSLRNINSIFFNDPNREKITIIETDIIDYLYSNKNFNVKLTRALSIGLGVPEIINPGKLYPINIQIKEPA